MGRRRGLIPPLAGGLVLAALSLVVSALGPLGLVAFLLPVPIAYLVYEEGFPAALLAEAVASLLVWPLLGPVFALGLLLGAFVPGMLMGEGLRSGEAPFASVLWSAFLVLLGMVAVTLATGLFASHGQDPLYAAKVAAHSLTKNLQDVARSVEQAYAANGLPRAEARRLAASLVARIRTEVLPLLPAITVLAVAVNMVLAYGLVRLLLRRHLLPPVPPFAEWTTPPWLPAVYLAATVLMMGWPSQAGSTWALVAQNVFLVAGSLLAVHGLAVLYYALHRMRAGRTLSLLALVAAVLIPLSLALLAWLAVADSLADFRRLGRRPGGA